jgi:ubiquinone/menaquinone biosynthesis C-methylase UbiE
MKSRKDAPTYEKIGAGYNITRQADPFLVAKIESLLNINPKSHYLDLACGTGNYTIALADRGGKWTGIDQSSVMIQSASSRSSQIDWHIADAEEIPLDNESFDGAIVTLALHHFADPLRVFQELARILKSGSNLVIFTATAEQMASYWLNYYFPEAMQRAILQMPTLSHTLNWLQTGGFSVDKCEPYFVSPYLKDFFLYSGKERPEMYLDERVRQGSSTFASLANPDEVTKGCAKLADDIASGDFERVYRQYDDRNGDYLFVRAIRSQLSCLPK